MFHYSLKITARRLSLLLGIYVVLRLAFYYFNQDIFESVPRNQLLLAFLHGFRFDAAAILMVNLPYLALSVFPGHHILQHPGYQHFLSWLFALVNIPFFFLNLADIEYFKIIGRRTSNELFTITQDIADQAGHLIVDYWYFLAATLLLGILLWRLYPPYRPPESQQTNYWKIQKILGLFFLAGLSVLIIRGGIQFKPLRITHAFMQDPAVLGNLALNSTFTFVKSLNNVSLERENYFPDQQAIARHLNFNPQQYQQAVPPAQRQNVIILILESFSSEYTGIENQGQGYTPFFDSLARQGTYFWKNYANGKRSIQALPSILAGLPSLMEDPFISSIYEANQLYGLGSILNPAGYTTSFFHGAANGTMGFNSFTKKIDINNYYGLNEYPDEWKAQDYDGIWGIMDEPYLQYVIRELNRQRPPFAATIFTLSSHDPYIVPEQHRGRFPKGELPIHETIGYTDYALRQFFKTAARQTWYPNTLFVLTGDHTQKTKRKGYKNHVAMHKVPLLFYHPTRPFPSHQTQHISQHVDILPTLVDYLQVPTNKLLPFGHSLLDSTATGKALYYLDGVTTLLHDDYLIRLYPDNQIKWNGYQVHGLRKAETPPVALKQQYSSELKAYLQYFRNGLIDNNLYYWLPKEIKFSAK